ncbi:ferritin, lower subunit [Colias croceus]|uniref:ferritin, lower subunit n=1 Tax=Colias crocea TaxID=72248 RepID=UPI001E281024|nr:ferritin, lower subunit [Colias croceus]XP_045506066.1 ferritin, lower subunit [Colias croceus]
MKAIILALTSLLALSAVSAESCYNDVSMDCGQASNSLALPSCNAVYGNYGRLGNVAIEMQAYANLHLRRSYEYLLSAAYYNNYQTNRLGFSKLFKKLSDETWDKTIELIKHITKRGGTMDFSRRSTKKIDERNSTIELQELESLAHALDTQKEIAERAFHIHQEATRNNRETHDPEIAQYLEEEFIEDHAKTIRNLAGHTSDLKQFIIDNEGQDLSLALYIFDEYLQKTV